mgnify:FL=1
MKTNAELNFEIGTEDMERFKNFKKNESFNRIY